ncbi:MAG: PEP-CTERM sorting domain-containing protein [Pseudomonadota bacterium]|nr:PEP-CTERM sorting domain-containing protein [Pseudomonadota bacterium]
MIPLHQHSIATAGLAVLLVATLPAAADSAPEQSFKQASNAVRDSTFASTEGRGTPTFGNTGGNADTIQDQGDAPRSFNDGSGDNRPHSGDDQFRSSSAGVVPEPATGALFAAGALAVIRLVRRRRAGV